jgi:hypothetical protein
MSNLAGKDGLRHAETSLKNGRETDLGKADLHRHLG